MKSIFKNPLILNGEEDHVVLVYSKYIIGNIKKEIVDLSIEGIDKDLLNPARFESLIKIKEIFNYKYSPGSDSCIVFGIKNITGISYKAIEFKDAETTKLAETVLNEHFQKLGFKRKEKRLSPLKAAVLPLIAVLIVALVGGLLTWVSYVLEEYNFGKIKSHSWYVDIFLKICMIVGYIPFLILSIGFLILCFLWLFKRILKPPYYISSIR